MVDDIINTDICIYMCDIEGDMHISESDFVSNFDLPWFSDEYDAAVASYCLFWSAHQILFKMHQLGLVDRELKEQLMDQFEALDFCRSGSLAIGFEIPDENQVKELQEELNTLATLSRLEDKLTVVRVNREHLSVGLHLADIERVKIDTSIKKRIVAPSQLTFTLLPTA